MLCLAQAKFFSCHFLGCEPLFINIVALLYEKVSKYKPYNFR